jgi:hypothetical protein
MNTIVHVKMRDSFIQTTSATYGASILLQCAKCLHEVKLRHIQQASQHDSNPAQDKQAFVPFSLGSNGLSMFGGASLILSQGMRCCRMVHQTDKHILSTAASIEMR